MLVVGRSRERARLERLLEEARSGNSSALLLHGDPGIGKTALLRWTVEQATDMQVLRARGMETESDIPFAGLAELITPLLDRLDAIPAPQAAALRGALALAPATGQDRFTVPAGLLSLLAVAAEEQPVLVLVDDAQWLDDPSLEAFLFAGRRLGAEGIAMLGAVRRGTAVARTGAPWLERLEIGPLADADAHAVLGTDGGERIAPTVAERLVSTAAGNPLALVELPNLLTAGQLAGREPLEEPLRAGTTIERAFRLAVEELPSPARRALLIAAAAHASRVDVVQAALGQADLSLADLMPAESARLVAIADGRLDFRHPLLRSTAYHASGPADRRAAHVALASAAAEGSAERAWHLAAGAVAPDESVAAALEAAALDARGRGAHATAARDFGRAAQLTPDAERRARRLLEAATDAARCGEGEQAQAQLAEAAALTADPLLIADVKRLTGHVEMRLGSPLVAFELLVAEADRVRSRDPRRAAAMFLEASVMHMMTGDMRALISTAERAASLATSADPTVELLCTVVIGEAHLALGDVAHGDALLTACEPYLLEGDPLALVEVVGMAGHASIWIERWDRARRILDHLVDGARRASAVSALIYPLAARSHLDFRQGRWGVARAGAAESVELGEDTGQLPIVSHSLGALARVEAGMGMEDDAREHVAQGLELCGRYQGDATAAYLHAALGLLELGLGRVPEAIEALETVDRMGQRIEMQPAIVQSTPDLIEAYVRAGRRDDAERALAGFATEAERTGSLWARATAARGRALLAPEEEMRSRFDDALALHAGLPMPFERARTLLVLGERLRRAKQRAEARVPLQEALDAFERLGARPWAERARSELRATGQTSARRSESAAEQLTPHELQIALLVAQGMTNREAAAALFLSPKTIEYHLGQIYRKLDVRGRAQLARLMAMELPEGATDPTAVAAALS
jgi:DNA-binding CsgD family transcriptional regulator